MFGGEYRAPAAEAHLNQVLAQLAKADDTPSKAYRVTILNTPAVNAFALPSGNLYVTRGLLALTPPFGLRACPGFYRRTAGLRVDAVQHDEHERGA